MDPSSLVPVADAIPVPWGWHYVLLLVTFVLHLLFMNTMLGTGVIAFVEEFRKTDGGAPESLSESLAHKLTYVIAFTVNLGVAPLLFLQVLYGQFIYVSSVLLAVYWISVVFLVIAAYYLAYIYNFRYQRLAASRKWVIGGAVALLLVVGFIFTNNMTLMLRPDVWQGYFDAPGGTILNWSDPTRFPRYLHFMVASLAVGGLFVAHLARYGTSGSEEERQRRLNLGMQWFTYATLAQIVIGIWFLISLKREVMLQFMGGETLYTMVLLLGIAGAMVLLVFGFQRRPASAGIALVGTIAVMAVMRDFVRAGYLEPYFTLSDLRLDPEYSPLILFLVVFVAGMGMVWYLLRLAAKTGKEG